MSQKMGLIIYVSLLLLTPKILSLLFNPQDNAFLSWAHSYAAFHNRSSCWVCGALPSSSVEGFLWWTSPLQGKDFLQVCEYIQQQSYVMPLLKLMTSNNPKMDWCNTCTLTMDKTWLLILIIHCLSLMTILLHIRQIGLDLMVFTWGLSNMGWGYMANSWKRTSNIYCPYMLGRNRAIPQS